MNRKNIIRCSIIVNIIFALLIGWLFMNIHFAKKQLFYTEVQENFGLDLSLSNAKYTKSISNSDREILEKLSSKLRQYPQDKLYEFSTLTKEDKTNFELLRTKIREARLGLNITINNDWNSFMSNSKALEESIESPLNK